MNPQKVKIILRQSIFRNSLYLILSTGILAVSGFLFWWLAARLSSAENVGIATTLVSVMIYIGFISQLGFNVSLIRYLPSSYQPSNIINTSITIVGLMGFLSAIVFLVNVDWIVNSLAFIRQESLLSLSFIAFMIFSSLNVTVDSIFIALRLSKNVFLKNGILSILKIIFIFILVKQGGYGIFAAWGIAIVLSVLLSFLLLPIDFKRKVLPSLNREPIKGMVFYSAGNYFSSLASNLSISAIPVILISVSGPENTAYFAIAMSFANLLFSIPVSVCNSLFAEGATVPNQIQVLTKRAVFLIVAIQAPALFVLLLFGRYALLLFGADYANHSYKLLILLAFSSIFVSINTIFWTLLNLEKRVREILVALISNAFLVIFLTYFLSKRSLIGAGFAWLVSQGLTVLIYFFLIFLNPLPGLKQKWFEL